MKIKANSTLIFSLKFFILLFISSLYYSQVLEIKVATSTINSLNGSPASYSFRIEGIGTSAVASDFTRTTLAPTFDYPYALNYGSDNYLWLTFKYYSWYKPFKVIYI